MKIFAKTKWFVIIVLVIAVAGAILLATVGLNGTPDFKAAYEVSVNVDDNVEGSGEFVKAEAEKYFAEKGYGYSAYATQVSDDGTTYNYKFANVGDISAAELEDRVQTAVTDDATLGTIGLVVKVNYSQTAVTSDVNAGMIILAFAIALLAEFIIALFMIKAAGALSVVCNAVSAALIYLFLMAVTRIPAAPSFYVFGATAALFASVLTFVLTNAFAERVKAESKSDYKAVAFEETAKRFKYLCFAAIAGFAACLLMAVTANAYMLFAGLAGVVAICSAAVVSCVFTPWVWSMLKSVGQKK